MGKVKKAKTAEAKNTIKKKAPSAVKEEVKPGLWMLQTEDDAEKKLTFENKSRDKQYIASVDFKGGDPAPQGETKKQGSKYVLSIHPGEVLVLATGSWKKFTKTFKSGPPDKEWLARHMAISGASLKKDMDAVKQLLKASGVTRVTAESTAKACSDAGIKFIDVTFPPREGSIKGPGVAKDLKQYPWKRASEYLDGTGLKPALFVGSIEPDDIDQGALADCYLMGALTAVAEFERLVMSAFESGQDPDLGLYRVTLCKNGWWQQVVLDDYFPCSGSKPAYARNREEPNELWVSLLEKAYAKLHGSYGAIMQGNSGAALGDITGCPYKTFEFTGEESTSFDQMLENDQNEFLQVLSTPGKNLMYVPENKQKAEDKELFDQYQAVGLICEHAYSLLSVVKTSTGAELCFIRNPWGNNMEWNGKWSDNDPSWTPELKAEVGFEASENGAFWMEWNDVKEWFSMVSVNYCHGTWDQIRVAGNFTSGTTDLCVAINVKRPTRIFFGAHQKDVRGVVDGPDAAYAPKSLFVVKEKKGKVNVAIALGTKKRDVYQECTCEAGYTYYFWTQPKEADVTKSFVQSLLVEDRNNVDVTFMSSHSRRYGAPKEFKPADWKPSDAQYQIKGQFSTNGVVMTRQGQRANFDGAAALALKNEQANFKATNAADRKKSVDPAKAQLFEMEVTVVNGKGLAAKDETGFSDPYCEVKLRDVNDGVVAGFHRHPQRRVTSVKQQTLNPEWNETFNFYATGGDAIRIHCFDKDEVGKDALGHCHILIPDLTAQGLKAGGSIITETYTLKADPGDGEVTGTVTVGVKILKRVS
eukprot:TRINITY_DN1768_c1_g4_i1.p1 TRINITY_DN1768_c1_g4~~TRINITY_DN1768_c1_g4_i1.p1  ORF type:complete len:813 (+),score=319.35 TRINITY_DN1768_c1_g4_i1:55-2493(+)